MQNDNLKLKFNKTHLFWLSSLIIWFWLAVFVYFSVPLTQILWMLILFPLAIFGIVILVNFAFILIKIIRLAKQKKTFFLFLLLLLLNVLVPIGLVISPLPEVYKQNQFARLKEERLAVVQNIVEEKYVITNDVVHLPESEWHLSASGFVFVIYSNDSNYYLFHYTTGIPDGYTGFLYSPVNVYPDPEALPEHVTKIEKMEDNWYWIEAD